MSNSTVGFSKLLNHSGSSNESHKFSISNPGNVGNQSALCERFRQVPLSVEIVDFSPEWDSTNGGSKVLVCIRPPIEGVCENNASSLEFERKFECSFGDTSVPVKFI